MARPTKQSRPAKVEAGIDRRAVLDAASRVLVAEGPSALTMRRLASEVGASTMVLYSRFAGREQLMGELLAEGFTRFADALGAVAVPDPWLNLRQLGRAYRAFALGNPTYFRLMWAGDAGLTSPAHVDAASPMHHHGQRAFGALLAAMTRVLAVLDRPAREAEPLALSVWSTVHGFVSLELSGVVGPDGDEAYERALDFIEAALRRG
ncbi:MAG: TetR/AcrR family transcriptional regulator [Myxococcales bacterium]|nr:MAG: TetR/AcrR family transcriptional regulator [Myxococcales bacterium]